MAQDHQAPSEDADTITPVIGVKTQGVAPPEGGNPSDFAAQTNTLPFSPQVLKSLMEKGERAYLTSAEHGTRIPFDGKSFSHTWVVFQELYALCRDASAKDILALLRTPTPTRMNDLRRYCKDDATFLKAISPLNELSLLTKEPVVYLTLEYFIAVSGF